MKRFVYGLLTLLTLVFTAALLAPTTSVQASGPKFHLTVTDGGTGTGMYSPGDTVKIKAPDPSKVSFPGVTNLKFSHWTIVPHDQTSASYFVDATKIKTKVKMPSNDLVVHPNYVGDGLK